MLERRGGAFLAGRALPGAQLRAFRHILERRTAALGGHMDVCPGCGEVAHGYNSCRDRHCPRCQAYAQERWVEQRAADLPGVGYFHLVFTLPAELGALAHRDQAEPCGLLFRCSWATVDEFASDPGRLGAKVGATSVPRAWGRRPRYHPHARMIVTGGGLTPRGAWRQCGKSFFAPVRAMSKVFRGKFLAGVRALAARGALAYEGGAAGLADPAELDRLVDAPRRKDWVVYAKPPFSGAGSALRYLGRHAHRVAISDSRIVSCEGGRVAFRYRDSRDGGRSKVCEPGALEFIRRFLMHVLPKGFCKKRHYGLLASRGKGGRLDLCRRLTGTPSRRRCAPDPAAIVARMIGRPPGTCRRCGCELVTFPIARPMRC